MRKLSYVCIFFLIFSCSNIYPISGLEQGKPVKERQKIPIVVEGDSIEYMTTEQKVVGKGNIKIKYQDVVLTCDRVEIDIVKRIAWAKGNVLLKQDTQILRAPEMEYHFDTGYVKTFDADMEVYPWYAHLKRGKRYAKKSYLAEDGHITTCPLDIMCHRIHGRQVKIYLDDKVVVRHAIFYIGNIPVMYLPYYSHSLKDNRVNVTVVPGRSDRWGYYVLTSWRYFLSENAKGNIRIDYRERKGWAQGIDYIYKTENFGKGIVNVYYMNEVSKDKKGNIEKIFDPATGQWHEKKDTRWKAEARHSWRPNDRTHVMAEYHKLSDETFLRDYFWRDYRIDPHPISYLSVINNQDESIFSLFAQKRVNRWMEEVERLPELKWDLRNYKLTDFLDGSFYFRSENSVSNLNKKFPAPSDRDYSALRADTYNKMSYVTALPGYLDFLQASPYIGVRQTLYQQTDNPVARTAFYSGWNLNTRFYKIIDRQTNFLGLNAESFRHIITPQVRFSYIDPQVPPFKIPQFDEIDSIDKTYKYTYSLENILQIKRRTDIKNTEKVELVYFNAEIDQYPFPKPHQKDYSNLRLQLQILPYNWLSLYSDAEYNFFTRDFDTVNTETAVIGKKWSVGLGTRYTKDTSTQGTLRASFQITDKWSAGVYQRFLFKNIEGRLDIKNRFEEQEYRLTGNIHCCWLMDIVYSKDKREGSEILVVFRLKAFPDIPIGPFRTTM